MVFSVGGGSREHNVSVNLVNAIELAHEVGAPRSTASSARPDGTLAQLADVAVVVDAPADLKTPLVESFQAVVWHALVSHPELALQRGHWESPGRRYGSAVSRRAVFVDRDGVINALVPDPRERPAESPLTVADVTLIPEPPAALRRLTGAGLDAGRRLQSARGGKGRRVARRSSTRSRPACWSCCRPRASGSMTFRLCLHHPDGVGRPSCAGCAIAASPLRACCSRPRPSSTSTWTPRG